jgi:transcriptional regulator with XRE-family HTH domain
MNKTAGNNIRRIRLFKDVLTETMAERLGISVSAYTKIERGETNLDLKRLELIAQALNIDVSLILSLDTEKILLNTGYILDASEDLAVKFKEVDDHYLVPKPLMVELVTMMKVSEKMLEHLAHQIEKLKNK